MLAVAGSGAEFSCLPLDMECFTRVKLPGGLASLSFFSLLLFCPLSYDVCVGVVSNVVLFIYQLSDWLFGKHFLYYLFQLWTLFPLGGQFYGGYLYHLEWVI